jgi:steroid delta-isomerase-like uncharacterized protein
MTRDEIRALTEHRFALINRADAAALALLHAEDGVVESPFGGGTARGREAIERVYRSFFDAFTPKFELEQILVDGDQVVVQVHVEGTDHGGLMGLPGSERSFKVSMVSVCTLRDGLITHERRIYDFTGLLVQIGAIKAKPA